MRELGAEIKALTIDAERYIGQSDSVGTDELNLWIDIGCDLRETLIQRLTQEKATSRVSVEVAEIERVIAKINKCILSLRKKHRIDVLHFQPKLDINLQPIRVIPVEPLGVSVDVYSQLSQLNLPTLLTGLSPMMSSLIGDLERHFCHFKTTVVQ